MAESCGQCTPCREGTGWLYRMLTRIVEGRGEEDDLDKLLDVANKIVITSYSIHYTKLYEFADRPPIRVVGRQRRVWPLCGFWRPG